MRYRDDMSEIMGRTIPIFRMFSVDKAKEYGDACPGNTTIVRIVGLEGYHREISAKGYRYMRPGIELAPWNARVMQVTDPFGNCLRFSESLPPGGAGTTTG
jgi:uncharacterized glyoxalase superfamily protein PhnB